MIVDIVMPKMGESITEGTILEWRKKVGDTVEKDELFLEIGTDKVDSEIPCLESGTIVEILADVNDIVEVGKVIARVETSTSKNNQNEKITPSKSLPSTKSSDSLAEETLMKPTQDQLNSQKSLNSDSNKFYTPAVLKAARLNKVSTAELDQIQGSGRKGRVTKKDILDYTASLKNISTPQPTDKTKTQFPTSSRSEEMDHMRKIISDHMQKSLQTSAHVHVVNELSLIHI